MGVLQPAQHWLFQLANGTLLLSYLVSNMLVLRVLLTTGCIFFTLWGAVVLDYSVDTIVWNGAFVLINLYHTCRLLAGMFPVKFDAEEETIYRHFFAPGKYFLSRNDFKLLVQKEPIKIRVPVAQLKQIGCSVDDENPLVTTTLVTTTVHAAVTSDATPAAAAAGATPAIKESPRKVLANNASSSIEMGSVHAMNRRTSSTAASQTTVPMTTISVPMFSKVTYKKGEVINNVGDPSQNTLQILLSGRVCVEKLRPGYDLSSVTASPDDYPDAWSVMNHLTKMDFLDSPEWAARVTERPPVFDVRIRVLSNEARVFRWHAAALEVLLKSSPQIEIALNGVVGVDLAKKVFTGNLERFAGQYRPEYSTTLREETVTDRGANKFASVVSIGLQDDVSPPVNHLASVGERRASNADDLSPHLYHLPTIHTDDDSPSPSSPSSSSSSSVPPFEFPQPTRETLGSLVTFASLAQDGHLPHQQLPMHSNHASSTHFTESIVPSTAADIGAVVVHPQFAVSSSSSSTAYAPLVSPPTSLLPSHPLTANIYDGSPEHSITMNENEQIEFETKIESSST